MTTDKFFDEVKKLYYLINNGDLNQEGYTMYHTIGRLINETGKLIHPTPSDPSQDSEDRYGLDAALKYLKEDGVRDDFFQDTGMMAYIAAHLANYAEDKDREIAELRVIDQYRLRLESELTEAKRRVAELEEVNRTQATWLMESTMTKAEAEEFINGNKTP